MGRAHSAFVVFVVMTAAALGFCLNTKDNKYRSAAFYLRKPSEREIASIDGRDKEFEEKFIGIYLWALAGLR
jgi:hypothetical protein